VSAASVFVLGQGKEGEKERETQCSSFFKKLTFFFLSLKKQIHHRQFSGVISGLGLSPAKICGCVVGVAKAYTTRVGAGPYPTEIHGDLAEELRAIGAEYGTTTGRPRRVGWLDVPALRYAARINGLTHINLTKLDVLSHLDVIRVGAAYELDGKRLTSVPASIAELERVKVVYEDLPGWKSDISGVREWGALPQEARDYVARVEELVGCGAKCAWIGVGPGRDAIVTQPGTV